MDPYAPPRGVDAALTPPSVILWGSALFFGYLLVQVVGTVWDPLTKLAYLALIGGWTYALRKRHADAAVLRPLLVFTVLGGLGVGLLSLWVHSTGLADSAAYAKGSLYELGTVLAVAVGVVVANFFMKDRMHDDDTDDVEPAQVWWDE